MTQVTQDNSQDTLHRLRRIVRQQLLSLQHAGLNVLPGPQFKYRIRVAAKESTGRSDVAAVKSPTSVPSNVPAGSGRPVPSEKPTAVEMVRSTYQAAAKPVEDRIRELAVIEAEVANCAMCSELATTRRNTVFGVGNPKPALCFLGEGPGADEDRQGEPFVGAAGQLLNRIIEACGLTREEVYILNTVKCRPPGNRNPNDGELANCWPYAVRQLEILQPDYICCLGSVAARTLLETRQSIGRLRGQFFAFRGSQVVVTYHPAYLLRNPAAKRQVWDDMKMLMAALGKAVWYCRPDRRGGAGSGHQSGAALRRR